MATLNTAFGLFNKYSSAADKIFRKTDRVINKILNASGATGRLNRKLEIVDKSVNKANRSLRESISAMDLHLKAVNETNISDEYNNINSKLGMVTNNQQEQLDIQKQIYAAVERSRGPYDVMVSSVPKSKRIEGYASGSNSKVPSFNELLRKTFKIGDLNQGEQTSSMLKLTKEMVSGGFEEDDIKSTIFDLLINKVKEKIGSEKLDQIINNLIGGLDVIAAAADKVLDGMVGIYNHISTNWSKLVPIIEGVTAAWMAYKVALLLVEAAQWAMNIAAMINPISLSILLVAALAGAFVLLWEKCEWFRKLYISLWKHSAMVTVDGYNTFATVFNLFVIMWNKSIDSIMLFVDALKNGLIAGVRFTEEAVTGMIDQFSLLIDAIGFVIDAYNKYAKVTGKKTIDFDISIPNIKNAIGAISDKAVEAINGAYGAVDRAFNSKKINKTIKMIDKNKVSILVDAIGDKMEDFTVSGWLEDIFNKAKGAMDGWLQDDDDDDPKEIKIDNKGDGIKVDMSKDDLQFLRDIAEREYINKFSTATLAPNVVFNISDIKETADINILKGTLEMMMREEIAIAAEGVY